MCRTALEFPPNGKRCGKGDHLTPEDREAWRIARNAREKQLYYARKEAKATKQNSAIPGEEGETIEDILAELDGFVQELESAANNPVPETSVTEPDIPVKDVISSAKQHLSAVSKNELRLADGQVDSTYLSTTKQREQLAALLNTDQGDLAYLPVTEDDQKFASTNDSTNDVQRVTLSDGTIGYFKPYEGAGDYDDSGTTADYGHSYLATSLNEVAAYRLSQALGNAFNGLVPETVIREYDGKLGTLQREAKGRTGIGAWELRKIRDDLDMTSWRRAAIFDIVAGSQDRHSWNYLTSENKKGQIVPTLIDNGYAFPDSNNYINMQATIDLTVGSGKEAISITERKALTKLKDDPTLGGLTGLISKRAVDDCRERIEKLLLHGIFRPTGKNI